MSPCSMVARMRAMKCATTVRAVSAGGLAVAACAVCAAGPIATRSPLATAPAAAQSWTNPYTGQADAVLAGEKLFRRHCTSCHGPDGAGSDRAPSLHTAPIRDAAPGTLFWFLSNGSLRHGMPSWSRLPPERRWQLVSYLEAINPVR